MNNFLQNHIVFKGNHVHRLLSSWTENVHRLLHHLRESGFYAAPLPIGFDEKGKEIVTYIPGKNGEFPSDAYLISETALISAAKLLRKFHDISVDFLIKQDIDHQQWLLKSRPPFEVICHGDFAPYNVVYDNEQIIGIIDFDCAHPGTRVWDLVYALYRFAPFTNPNNTDGFGTIDEQIARAKLFLDSYDLNMTDRIGFAQLIIERLEALIDFMFTQANMGNQIHKINIENGHHLQYKADINYIRANKLMVDQGLCC